MGRHPFHLHGHHFQAVFQSKRGDGLFKDKGLTENDLPQTPIRRDTLVVNPGGSIVVRFRANNPGASPPSVNVYLPARQSVTNLGTITNQEYGYSTATWNGTPMQDLSPPWWKTLLHSRSGHQCHLSHLTTSRHALQSRSHSPAKMIRTGVPQMRNTQKKNKPLRQSKNLPQNIIQSKTALPRQYLNLF